MNTIVSLGQFRPEKDHPLQLRALAKVRDQIYEDSGLKDIEKDKKWEKVSFSVFLISCINNKSINAFIGSTSIDWWCT